MTARVLIVGLPRSGTTWVGEVLAAAPRVTYVHEPDNPAHGRYAAFAFADLRGALIEPGRVTPRYRRLWRLAFRGGWPVASPPRAVTALRRLASARRAPLWAEGRLLDVAARVAADQSPESPVIVVKSVAAHLAVDWLAEEFSPRVAIVWRHPLNVVSAWLDRGWRGIEMIRRSTTITDRFTDSVVWPPPAGDGIAATAWGLCAQQTWLFEFAQRRPDCLVLHHERTCLSPVDTFRDAFRGLGVEWSDAVDDALESRRGRGTGYATVRIAEEEPTRWEQRLPAEDVRAVLGVLERFAEASPAAARQWSGSPAIAGQRG
jgi:hypothetical protein